VGRNRRIRGDFEDASDPGAILSRHFGIEEQADVSGTRNNDVLVGGAGLSWNEISCRCFLRRGFPPAADDERVGRESAEVAEGKHFPTDAGSRAHRGRRDGDHAGNRNVSGNAKSDSASERMANEKSSFRKDGMAFDEIFDERFGARFRTIVAEWPGRGAVAGQIRSKHAEVLVGKRFGKIKHDSLVGGKAVQEDHETISLRSARADDIHAHAAAAGGGNHGVGTIGLRVEK